DGMKFLIKNAWMALAPQSATAFFSRRSRRHARAVLAGFGNAAVVARLTQEFGYTVQSGPFAGLRLPEMAAREQLGPFLLGTYESEIAAAWELVLAGSYPQIVDIGAAFGYYAVGLARRYPAAAVVAFDT